MFIEKIEDVVSEEAPRTAGAGKARLPPDFVYDNGQIMLELLLRRAAEEERRGFVEGLRRLGVNSKGMCEGGGLN